MDIELGGGNCPKKDYVNIDFNGHIKHDLNHFPYPLCNNSVNNIYSRHCLEHIKDFGKVILELYRISKNGCKWDFTVPYFSSPFAYYPAHKSFFNSKSFNYVEEEGINKKIKIVVEQVVIHFYAHEKKVSNEWVRFPFKMIEWFVNKNQFLYERFFCWILPAYEARFLIKVVK